MWWGEQLLRKNGAKIFLLWRRHEMQKAGITLCVYCNEHVIFTYLCWQYAFFISFHFCSLHLPLSVLGLVTEGSSTQQCYMGICLPRELASLYPRDDPATRSAEEKERDHQRGSSDRRRSTSLGEMEDLQEAGLFWSYKKKNRNWSSAVEVKIEMWFLILFSTMWI